MRSVVDISLADITSYDYMTTETWRVFLSKKEICAYVLVNIKSIRILWENRCNILLEAIIVVLLQVILLQNQFYLASTV